MKKAPSESQGPIAAAAGVAGRPHITGSATQSLATRDTTPTGERAFIDDTVTTGIYVHREQIVARLHEVGLLKHPQVVAAIASVEAKEASGELNGELQKPEGFARAVFLELTGSKAAANTVVTQLIHDPDVTEYPFGDKGVIVDRHYGKGGMAEILAVYFYGDPDTGSYKGVAAVKAANATDVSKTKDRFGVEMKLMAKHSNGNEKGKRGYRTIFAEYYKETGVIPLINPDSTTIEERDYYAMELLKGHSLQDVLDEILEDDGLPLDPQVAIDLLVTLLVKLKNFKGEMHRDIKPDNIFVLDDGTVRFLDCGLSLEESSENVTRMTQTTDGAMGTLSYMAPEQLGGGGKGGKIFASDVYSLAASIYELVTRALPVEGEGAVDFYMAHDKGQKPSFIVNSKVSHANLPEPVEGVEPEPLLLDNLNPALAGALRQMLNFNPEERLVPGTDADRFLRDDPRYKDGRQDFHMTDKEAKAQLEKWIDELLPASSFTVDDIEDGNPSIFQSAVLPENKELTPGLQLGSDLTRHEMYGILTGPSLATLKELEKFEAEKLEAEKLEAEQLAQKVAVEKSAYRKKVAGWTAGITAGVALSVGALMYGLSGKKSTDNVGPDTPIGGQIDPSNTGSAEHVVKATPPIDNTPAEFRDYPGNEKLVFIPGFRGWSMVEVGNDCLLFYQEEFEAKIDKKWAEGIESDGVLKSIKFNQYHGDSDAGLWQPSNNGADVTFEGSNGTSGFRSFIGSSEKYRTEIGSEADGSIKETYMNGVRIGDYVLCIVDGESESTLYYIGRDKKDVSKVFLNAKECEKYLSTIEHEGKSLYEAFNNLHFEVAAGERDENNIKKPGYNVLGHRILKGTEKEEANKALSGSIQQYFMSKESPGSQAIAERQ